MHEIAKAVDRDIKEVLTLLEEVDLPVEGVVNHFHNFLVVREDNRLMGCAGIEMYNNVGLVRSVAVHPSFQGRGIGRQLVERIHDLALENGLKRVYLITETAEAFFSMLGYIAISREAVDPEIKQTAEFIYVCPASGLCMVRFLE